MKLLKPNELENSYINILRYGEPGSGKTRFAGEAARLFNKSLFIVVDPNELLTIKTMPNPPRDDQYDILVIESEEDLYPIVISLRINRPSYELVVLDNATEIQRTKKRGITQGNMSDEDIEKLLIEGKESMDASKWGELFGGMFNFIMCIKAMPIHMIVNAHTDIATNLRTGDPRIYPGLQGGIKQVIASVLDIAGYCFEYVEGGEKYYCMTTRGTEKVVARDRFNLDRAFVNPSFQMFLDLLEGKILPEQTDLERRLDQKQITWKPVSNKVDMSKVQGKGR